MIIDNNGKKRIVFGNGTLRIIADHILVDKKQDCYGIFIKNTEEYLEPGLRPEKSFNLNDSHIVLLFETKEDLKVLKEAIKFIESLMEFGK